MSYNPWIEKRKARRRNVLDVFSFYICLPKLGYTRHAVNDVSELGIGLTVDTLGEFKLSKGEKCELHFYLNQSLYLPLKIEVVRHVDQEHSQQVGALFIDTETTAYEAFLTLVTLLDQLGEAAERPGAAG